MGRLDEQPTHVVFTEAVSGRSNAVVAVRRLRERHSQTVLVVQGLRRRAGEDRLSSTVRMDSVGREARTEGSERRHELRQAERTLDVAPVIKRAQIEIGE